MNPQRPALLPQQNSDTPTEPSEPPVEGEVAAEPHAAIVLNPISSEADILSERLRNAPGAHSESDSSETDESDHDYINNPINTRGIDLQVPPLPGKEEEENVLIFDEPIGVFPWLQVVIFGLIFPVLVASIISGILRAEGAIISSQAHRPFYEPYVPYAATLLLVSLAPLAIKKLIPAVSSLSRYAPLVAIAIIAMTYSLNILFYTLHLVHEKLSWGLLTSNSEYLVEMIVSIVVAGLFATFIVAFILHYLPKKINFAIALIILIIAVGAPYGVSLLVTKYF